MLLGDLAGIASAALWALTSSVFGGLSSRVPPVGLSALRLLCGVLFYAVVLIATGNVGALFHLSAGQALALVMVAWIGLGVGDTLYIAGVQRLGVGRAAPISVTSYPLLTIVAAWLLLGERLSVRGGLAAALIVAGIGFVVFARTEPLQQAVAAEGGPPAATPEREYGRVAVTAAPPIEGGTAVERRRWLGLVLVLTSAAAWSISTVWLRALSVDGSVLILNAVRVPAAALLVSAGALRLGQLNPRSYSPSDLLLVLFAGVVGSGVGTILFVYSLQAAGAVTATLLNSLMPVFALPIAVFVLGERVTKLTVGGTAVALVGVYLTLS